MDNIIRATYTHPDLASLGILEGHLKHDPWEGKTLFFPDEKHTDALLSSCAQLGFGNGSDNLFLGSYA